MVAPSTQALLTQWTWEPSVLLGILITGSAYAYAIGPLRRKHGWAAPTAGQIAWFVLAEAILVIALLSPIDAIGDRYLFSVHMVQHILLAAIWPPLVLMALPEWMVRPLFRMPGISTLAGFLIYPAIAIALFNVDIYLWHLPGLYDATLTNEGVHILEHVSFMALGLVNWWPVLGPLREMRLSYPLQILYLFLDGMFMMVLGIIFTFAPIVFYEPYSAAPRLWGLSALTDQQIGGLIMWYPGNLPYGALLVIAFYRWFDGSDPSRERSQSLATQSPTIDSPRQEVMTKDA
ncbi:MAG TPA: cytochrome c oxidase assembly protein [Chloroflexota bacterium]